MTDNEAILPLKPETDFHRLLFAQKEIKDLKAANRNLSIEIGKLKSELDEIKDTDKIKRLYLQHKEELKVLQLRVRDLRKENDRLYETIRKNKKP